MALLVIEGIDATGKTTLAKSLSQLVDNGVYYKTPGNKTAAEREHYDQPGIEPIERFQFYLNACREDIERILEMERSGKNIVCDRLLASTIVGHKSMDNSIDTTAAEELDKSFSKKQILLTARIDTVLERLSYRPTRTRFENNPNFLQSMQDSFKKRNFDLVLSTDKNNAQQVLKEVLNFIKNHE